uniref:Uncharacterized protein n=1 Tax=Leersia perrieri TaxID=77586 RepID=A0A0D9WU00_9ORYZ
MASSSPPSTASSTSSSPYRKLLHSLIYWAVQRCRMSESPCRLTISVKRSPESACSSPLRISVSDTGVGSKLEEFLELDDLTREIPVEKWDGTLFITTTGINDKTIYRYQFNLQEDTSSSARFTKLATTSKICLCLSTEADVDDFILWLVGFVRKIFVLRASNLACELFVEQTASAESGHVCLSQDSDDVHLSITTSSIDRLVSGLKDYALSHGNTSDRDHLKIGTGAAKYVDKRKDKGQLVEVVIMIAHTSSDLSCWMTHCSSTQVLHFEDFVPCLISQSSFNVLTSIDWQSYGFKSKGGFMDDDGNAVLQWDNMAFARSIAGLILSSNDQEFQDECIALLGLGSDQDLAEGTVRSCISEKMNRVIKMNDTKENVEHNTPYLFECERLDEDYIQLHDEDQDLIRDF